MTEPIFRWSTLAIYPRAPKPGGGKNIGAAKGALEPDLNTCQRLLKRRDEVASPGSSLIISDEAMHPRETGKGTDSLS